MPLARLRAWDRVYKLSVEDSSNRRGELPAVEGLLNQFDARIQPALMDNGVARISRHEQDLQRRPTLAGFFRKLAAVHAGHDDIGQQETDRLVFVDQAKSILAAPGFEHVIAKPSERLHDIGAHIGIVLDDQNAFARMATSRFAPDILQRRRRSDEPAQIDFDCRASPTSL